MKITRLAAVKQGTYGYAGILHEHMDVFVSSAAIVVLYLEYYIHKTNALLQEAGGHIRNHDESTINPQVLINLLPVERRAKIDELRAPQFILNHYRMLWFSRCCLLISLLSILLKAMSIILLHVTEKTDPQAENIVRPSESWSYTSLFLSSSVLMIECVYHSQRGQD